MAEVNLSGNQRRQSPRVDMTPMVDLGFLLVTFFMVTTSFIKLSSIELKNPPKAPPKPIKMSRAITLVPFGKDSVFYFNGLEAKWNMAFQHQSKQNINNILENRKAEVQHDLNLPVDERSMIVLIKPAVSCKFDNLVQIMNAMEKMELKNNYALIDISNEETAQLQKELNR